MAQANDAEPQRGASGCTSVRSVEMNPTQQAELDSKQKDPSGRLQPTPSDGRQSWHYDTLSSLHLPPDSFTTSEDYGPDGAAEAWAPQLHPPDLKSRFLGTLDGKVTATCRAILVSELADSDLLLRPFGYLVYQKKFCQTHSTMVRPLVKVMLVANPAMLCLNFHSLHVLFPDRIGGPELAQ